MNADKIRWQQAIPRAWLSPNDVHVWRVYLDPNNFQAENLPDLLSADEITRAAKYYFARDKNSFIVARAVLRMILGRYLRKDPRQLRFEYTAHGKPVLAQVDDGDNISFNLSHSGGIALYAFTRGRNIGIDVERVRENVDVRQIAQRFFSATEIRSMDNAGENRFGVFFQYWTRKEAFIKARGEGISFPMELCDVSMINGEGLSPVKLLHDTMENSAWYVVDLFPGPGYAAAIAVEGNAWNISYWDYSE